jgi:hypothetical protein
MLRLFLITIIISIISICCVMAEPGVFNEKMLSNYPSEPAQFQKKFGGQIQYVPSTPTTLLEKNGEINKAYLRGDGFEVSFWKRSDYYIHHLIITRNTIKVLGVSVIGKSAVEIIEIFGNPKVQEEKRIIYQSGEFSMTFGIKDGMTIRCYLGLEM